MDLIFNDKNALRTLAAANKAWTGMADFRERRRRFLRYTYGDQWSDIVKDYDGTPVAEREIYSRNGREPLSNNLIRRMVKAVVGRFRQTAETSDAEQPQFPGTDSLALDELDARTFEEFLISAMAIHHVELRRRLDGSPSVHVANVPPDTFFAGAMSDSRCRDAEMVGRLLSLSLGEVLMRFSHGSRKKAVAIKRLYRQLEGGALPEVSPLGDSGDESFFTATDGRCRVVEVWTLETREVLRCHDPENATFTIVPIGEAERLGRYNRQRRKLHRPQLATRWELLPCWHCRMLAPDGTVLDEFDSPLADGCHPFAIKMYPLVDGRVHSLVEDVIDQQRHVNRLIAVMDEMMGYAAKGVLLFPVGCKVEEMQWEHVARNWADPGAVIPYRPFQGAEPHQVSTPVADIGARELLQTQIKLFEDVSGVTGALMGKADGAGVGVDRFNSEIKQSAVAVNDLLQTFMHFIKVRNSIIANVMRGRG